MPSFDVVGLTLPVPLLAVTVAPLIELELFPIFKGSPIGSSYV